MHGANDAWRDTNQWGFSPMCIQLLSVWTLCVSGKGTEFVTSDLWRKVTFLWSFTLIFLYKWAVLHLQSSGQRCQSFKKRNRTEWVRDCGISNGKGSPLAENSQWEDKQFLCCKDCKVGRKKRNEIDWSCKLESSQVGPIWKRLSEEAFELLMKQKKPQ